MQETSGGKKCLVYRCSESQLITNLKLRLQPVALRTIRKVSILNALQIPRWTASCVNGPLMKLPSMQVVRMLVYLFHIWSFTTMKICPIAWKFCKSRLKILPNTEWAFRKLPKWRFRQNLVTLCNWKALSNAYVEILQNWWLNEANESVHFIASKF